MYVSKKTEQEQGTLDSLLRLTLQCPAINHTRQQMLTIQDRLQIGIPVDETVNYI